MKYNLGLFSKNPILFLFHELRNMKSAARQHSKVPKYLCGLGKSWKYRLRPPLRNANFEAMYELEKVMSQFKIHC